MVFGFIILRWLDFFFRLEILFLLIIFVLICVFELLFLDLFFKFCVLCLMFVIGNSFFWMFLVVFLEELMLNSFFMVGFFSVFKVIFVINGFFWIFDINCEMRFRVLVVFVDVFRLFKVDILDLLKVVVSFCVLVKVVLIFCFEFLRVLFFCCLLLCFLNGFFGFLGFWFNIVFEVNFLVVIYFFEIFLVCFILIVFGCWFMCFFD